MYTKLLHWNYAFHINVWRSFFQWNNYELFNILMLFYFEESTDTQNNF